MIYFGPVYIGINKYINDIMFPDSWAAARARLPSAMDTDGLESDQGDTGRGCRKKFPTQVFTTDEVMDDDYNPGSQHKKRGLKRSCKEAGEAQQRRKKQSKQLPSPPQFKYQPAAKNLFQQLRDKRTAILKSKTFGMTSWTYKLLYSCQDLQIITVSISIFRSELKSG